jgi:hypothetical protein
MGAFAAGLLPLAAHCHAHLGWGSPVPGEFALVAVDTTEVTDIGHDAGSNAQHVARWPAGEEYLRHSLTPAVVPEPRGACSPMTQPELMALGQVHRPGQRHALG